MIPIFSVGFVTVDLQMMMGIMGDPSTQLEGLVHPKVVQGVYPCPKELPPWFLERQNISRRHPGHGFS